MEQQYALVVRAWSPGTSVPHLSPSSATYCASVSSSGKKIIIIITSEKGGLGELVYGRYIEQAWYLGSVLMIALLLFFTSIFSELKIGDWAIHVLKKLSVVFWDQDFWDHDGKIFTFLYFLEQFRKHRGSLLLEVLKRSFDTIRTDCFFGENLITFQFFLRDCFILTLSLESIQYIFLESFCFCQEFKTYLNWVFFFKFENYLLYL